MHVIRDHIVAMLVVGIALCLGLPAVAAADVTFGSDLAGTPIGIDAGCGSNGLANGSSCTVVAGSYPANNAFPTAAPISGVITRITIKTTTVDSFRVRLVRPGPGGLPAVTAVATGPLLTTSGTGAPQSFAVHLPVQAGDLLAADGSRTRAVACDGGSDLTYSPPLADGATRSPTTTISHCHTLANATISTSSPGPITASPGSSTAPHASFISRHQKAIMIAADAGMAAGAVISCAATAAAGPESFGLAFTLASVFCAYTESALGGLAVAIVDPPDSTYAVVYKPPHLPLPAIRTSCKRLSLTACANGKQLLVRYARAVVRVASLALAVGVTVDRHSGALAGGDQAAADTQRRALARYLPELDVAFRDRKAAGRSLGRWLIRYHLNKRLSAGAVRQAKHRTTANLPGSVIHRLVQLKLIANRRALAQLIQNDLRKAVPPRSTTLAQLLGR